MLDLKTQADLQRLVDEGLEKGPLLDYKASPALVRQDQQVNELCKDVSAFANSAGGQIVYGIEEDRKIPGKPIRVDEEVEDARITPEWVEQIIVSRIQPRILSFRAIRIPLSTGRSAFVVSVSPTTIGAHQAPDKKYYRRYNLTSVATDDYEIRGINARATAPSLELSFRFGDGRRATTVYLQEHGDEFAAISLEPTISNVSPSPAYYTAVTIYLDKRITLKHRGTWMAGPVLRAPNGVECHTIPQLIGIPKTFPIFKERPVALGEFLFSFHNTYFMRGAEDFVFGYYIQSPGFELSRFGDLTFANGNLRFEWPE